MRDKVAPTCDLVLAENLEVWQGWCKNSDENLIDAFHKLMHSLKLPVLQTLKYDLQRVPSRITPAFS